MTFEEYQKKSREKILYPGTVGDVLKEKHHFIFPAIGLAGETGEVLEKVKKIVRDQHGVVNDDAREQIAKEIGDVLWYLSQLATELNISLEEAVKENIEKIQSRHQRGTLQGSGDNR